MKTRIAGFVLGGLFSALAASSMLQAQERTIAEIPFDFQVRNEAFPAGSYTIVRAANPEVFAVESNQGGRTVFALAQTEHLHGRPDAKVSFRCYGNRCFLSGMGMPDGRTYTISPTKLEKELIRGGEKVAMAYVPLNGY